ncbi:MAG: hypothetical protein RSE41_09690, partial [Clostridia bacterium]
KTKDDHMINYLEFRTSDKNKNEPYAPLSARLDIDNSEDDNDFVSRYYKKKILISSAKFGTTIVMKKINDDTTKFDYL